MSTAPNECQALNRRFLSCRLEWLRVREQPPAEHHPHHAPLPHLFQRSPGQTGRSISSSTKRPGSNKMASDSWLRWVLISPRCQQQQGIRVKLALQRSLQLAAENGTDSVFTPAARISVCAVDALRPESSSLEPQQNYFSALQIEKKKKLSLFILFFCVIESTSEWRTLIWASIQQSAVASRSLSQEPAGLTSSLEVSGVNYLSLVHTHKSSSPIYKHGTAAAETRSAHTDPRQSSPPPPKQLLFLTLLL